MWLHLLCGKISEGQAVGFNKRRAKKTICDFNGGVIVGEIHGAYSISETDGVPEFSWNMSRKSIKSF